MLNRDPRCVFVGNSMASAVVTATWLNNNGIPAQVMDQMTSGGLEGLTYLWPTISTRGMEVWVDQMEHIAEARRLLAEHETEFAREAADLRARGPVDAVCEECGKSSTFPAEENGTTQSCPHCGAYIDVSNAVAIDDETTSDGEGLAD